MITLTLVHRISHLPAQSWTFKDKPVICIGRSTDNDVILHSAVVSRHHLELQCRGCRWKIINLGSNGTYFADRPITEASVENGMILQLARSGPQLQIHIKGMVFKNVAFTAADQTLLVV